MNEKKPCDVDGEPTDVKNEADRSRGDNHVVSTGVSNERKWRRKPERPRRAAERDDPNFKGVHVIMELFPTVSKPRLLITEKHCNPIVKENGDENREERDVNNNSSEASTTRVYVDNTSIEELLAETEDRASAKYGRRRVKKELHGIRNTPTNRASTENKDTKPSTEQQKGEHRVRRRKQKRSPFCVKKKWKPCTEDDRQCFSCYVTRTPMWRCTENGLCLCNACGIRYRKYGFRCCNCWYIPKRGDGPVKCRCCGKDVKGEV